MGHREAVQRNVKRSGIVRLEDLDPRRDVRGGAGKHVFGEIPASLESQVSSRKSRVESAKTHTKAIKEKRHDDEA
jgi:hypothetical protein